ncbi:MAG: AIM24 family protein, partial [Planctomycetota bacterium]|nr:AIM24 family protein [Planctomycetota bacterium]
YIVDSGHPVAYEPSIRIRIGMAGGIFTSVFSGEGLVTRVSGPGRIYMQSRSVGGRGGGADSRRWCTRGRPAGPGGESVFVTVFSTYPYG